MTQETRSRLVAVAAELLDGGGPAAVTLRDVGKRAGVSHNAPYKHFPSKEDLLAAIASGELERQSRVMSAARPGKSPLDSLRSLMHGYVRWAQTYPQRFRLTFGAGSPVLGLRFAEMLADWRFSSRVTMRVRCGSSCALF